MSLIDKAKDDLLTAIAKLPVEAVLAVIKLVQGALASDDPTRYIQRRAEAELAHEGTKAAAAAALKARAKKG